jgi:hypothetical protein
MRFCVAKRITDHIKSPTTSNHRPHQITDHIKSPTTSNHRPHQITDHINIKDDALPFGTTHPTGNLTGNYNDD